MIPIVSRLSPFLSLALLCLATDGVGSEREPDFEPRSPEESLRVLHLPEGYTAEIVAAEPLLLDPVAFDWDAEGNLWVVEMADYPLGLDNEGARGGRIRVLEDRDGDGRYDHSTLYADDLNFPTGLITWRNGVVVTAAPDILYLEDTTGDGLADKREILFTGLTEGNEQLRANGLRWGLDNWVYVAAGGHHGRHGADTELLSTRTGEKALVGSRDFRIRPDTGEVEPQSGPAQFGRDRDDWGRWFGTQNSHPLWHYVLPDHYLRRNPHFAAPEGRVQLPGGSNPRVYAVSPPEKRFHSFQQAGRYTSACGGTIYRDSLLFPEGATMAFIAEPFHNLVQQLELKDAGVSFSAKRVGEEGDSDFFASEDRWCRPVLIRTGPDGNLWIADMYRYMIEHPHWLPQEGKDELLPHYRLGDDKGRIYRVSRTDSEAREVPDLSSLEPVDLVRKLQSLNGWIRDKAHQMLVWQGGTAEVFAALQDMALTSASPLARLHALCTLEGLDQLDSSSEALLAALSHSHPGLRENAARLAETSADPLVVEAVLGLASDSDAKVRLQLAFTLGEWERPESGEVLAHLLNSHPDEPFLTASVLSSALPHLETLVASATPATRPALLPMALAAGDREAVAKLVAPAFTGKNTSPESAPEADWDWIRVFLDDLAARKLDIASMREGGDGDSLAKLLSDIDPFFSEAEATMSDESAPLASRLSAAALLARHTPTRKTSLAFLAAQLRSSPHAEGWSNVLATYAPTADDSLPALLLEQWPQLSPKQRELAFDALSGRPAWAALLLEAVEGGSPRIADIDATRRMRLLNSPDKALKARAAALFHADTTPGRAEVIARYRPSLERDGDVARGQIVYRKACAACHQHGEEGLAVGPRLETVVDHPGEKLLASILDPNLDIQPGYHAYTATLKSGEQLFGLLAAESAVSLTFKTLDAQTRAIRRDEIASLQSTDVSLMPEGLEAAISLEEMADLIAFLRKK